jgi:hypothetical protein
MQSGLAPTWNPIVPKIFRHFEFSSKKLWPYELSSGTFLFFSDFKPEKLGRKNFKPNFFAIFNFHAKNFPVKKISRPKKVRVLRHSRSAHYSRFYDGGTFL